MTLTQFPFPATSYPLSFQSTAASFLPRAAKGALPKKSSPLESCKSSLPAAEALLPTQLAQSLEGSALCEGQEHRTTTLTTFRINTCKSVSKQRTLTPSRMNTYKKTGGYPNTSAKLPFRRHMRHVAPLSLLSSVDCAYFPSPQGCTPNRCRFLGVCADDLHRFQAELAFLLRASFADPYHAALQGAERVLIQNEFDDLPAPQPEIPAESEPAFPGVDVWPLVSK